MLITEEKVNHYINSIPPLEKTLKDCIVALKSGDLPKASKIANQDMALMFYLKDLTTKPIYGFNKEITDPAQIFGILGLTSALAVVKGFLFSKLLPEKFLIFNIKKDSFLDLQDQMLARWIFILEELNIKDTQAYTPLAMLLTATGVFCDNLFADNKKFIDEIKVNSVVNYNSILEKLTKLNVFHISKSIGQKWEMNEKTIEVLDLLANKKKDNSENEKIAKFLYLLFFFMVSKPEFINSGLNDFILLDTEFIEDIILDFNTYMEKYDSANS